MELVEERYIDKMADLLEINAGNMTIFQLERQLYETGIIKKYPALKEVLREIHSEIYSDKEKEELMEQMEDVAFKT